MSELDALAQARDLLRSLEQHWPADAVARVIIELPMLRGLADRLEAAEAAIERVQTPTQAPDIQTIAQAITEYGDALRGSWGEFDGRSNRIILEDFAEAMRGGVRSNETIAWWRNELGVCPDGGGHWAGRWGYCETDDGCPSLRGESGETSE